jgi:hypothetical protein
MSSLIALRAVFGQDEASHGVRRYRVDNNGLVHVPAMVALFLTGKGGFVAAKTTLSGIPENVPPMAADTGKP